MTNGVEPSLLEDEIEIDLDVYLRLKEEADKLGIDVKDHIVDILRKAIETDILRKDKTV